MSSKLDMHAGLRLVLGLPAARTTLTACLNADGLSPPLRALSSFAVYTTFGDRPIYKPRTGQEFHLLAMRWTCHSSRPYKDPGAQFSFF
jgi:hypothetical protein